MIPGFMPIRVSASTELSLAVVVRLARMYQTLRSDSPGEFEIFGQRAAAENWLGLPEGYAAQLTEVAP